MNTLDREQHIMTIYEEHQKLVKEVKKRHRVELDELNGLLKSKQAKCKHPHWTRYESLFMMYGDTWPGEVCDECGQQRRV
jgi:hypothetical protein